MRLALIFLINFFFLSSGYSQNSQPFVTSNKGLDVGINITSLITNLVGSDNQSAQSSELPVYIRWTRAKSAIRIGAGTNGFTSDFFDNVGGSFRTSKQQEYSANIGVEVHTAVDGRWQFYYGLDVIGRWITSSVEVNSGQFLSNIDQRTIGFGLSPFVGMRLFLGSRFYLSTEANLSYVYSLLRTKQAIGGFNPGQETLNTTAEEFKLNAPISIYMNYRIK